MTILDDQFVEMASSGILGRSLIVAILVMALFYVYGTYLDQKIKIPDHVHNDRIYDLRSNASCTTEICKTIDALRFEVKKDSLLRSGYVRTGTHFNIYAYVDDERHFEFFFDGDVAWLAKLFCFSEIDSTHCQDLIKALKLNADSVITVQESNVSGYEIYLKPSPMDTWKKETPHYELTPDYIPDE